MRGRFYPRSTSVILRATVAGIALAFVVCSHGRIAAQASQPPPPKWQPAPVPAWQTAAGGHQEFDVVSVRQNKSGPPWSGGDQMVMNVPYGPDDNYRVTGGILSAKNYPLLNLIVFAYKVPTAQGQALLESLPAWTNRELFDIEARTENRDVTKDQMRLMMQSLLAERFHLVIHRELRQVNEYAAVLIKPGKLGPNIRPHPADEPCSSIYVAPVRGWPPARSPRSACLCRGIPAPLPNLWPRPGDPALFQDRRRSRPAHGFDRRHVQWPRQPRPPCNRPDRPYGNL